MSPFAEFLRSYREHEAGVAHELLLLCKGFETQALPAEYRALLDATAHRTMFVADEGFDIAPYFAAARANGDAYFCFLNSFSRVLDAGWLAKLYAHARTPGVGVTSATGSYESHYTSLARALRPFDYLRRTAYSLRHARRPSQGLREYLTERGELAKARAVFDPFPNYHVRTNAFLIARDVMLDLKVGVIGNKMDATAFESGKQGLTRQLFDKGLRALVVGRDGLAYEKERWRESRTFRSGEQQNLLVADNRTRQYAEADAQTKVFLERCAWGF
ncbi:MAG TPA: hypothetical protein VGW12_20550 [Pyrinomonadaceae bacterium]|nr:hypothetical protein [Pyrinomonadaceae bacterium]